MYIMRFCNQKHIYEISNHINNVDDIHCFEVRERLSALEEFNSKQNNVFTSLMFNHNP